MMRFKLPAIAFCCVVTIFLWGCGSDSDDADGTNVAANLTWVSIPAGFALVGTHDDELHPEEAPVHTVYFDSFSISKTEITNYQYVEFLNDALENGYIFATASKVYGAVGDYVGDLYIDLDGSVAADEDPANGCHIYFSDGVFSVEAGYEDWPVTYVSWYGAYAFTQFYAEFSGVNMGLPTEAEWEYVAQSDTDFIYPTDDGFVSCEQANYECGNSPGRVVVAGNYHATPWGVHDMGGNVREWCWDWYDPEYYSRSPATNSVNLSGTEPPQDGSAVGGAGETYNYDTRVVRGGSYQDPENDLRSSARSRDYPFRLNSYTGFRVVKR